jgi:hypothetical protein
MMPAEWSRESAVRTVDALDPVLAAALRAHVEKHALGDVLDHALLCCETVSRGRRRRWFGLTHEDRTTLSAVVLTPGWLVVAVRAPDGATSVVRARASEIEVRDYVPGLVEDHGIDVYGVPGPDGHRSSLFVGLGRGEAAERLREQLRVLTRWGSGR